MSAERPEAVGFDHVGLSVTDLAKTTAFYCDVLGGDVAFGEHDAGPFRRVVVRLGSWIVDINQSSTPTTARRSTRRVPGSTISGLLLPRATPWMTGRAGWMRTA